MNNETTDNRINYLKLDTLEDVKTLVCDVLTECRDTGSMVEHAAKITQLLQVWLKAHQMGQLQDLEKRVQALEEVKQ